VDLDGASPDDADWVRGHLHGEEGDEYFCELCRGGRRTTLWPNAVRPYEGRVSVGRKQLSCLLSAN
jgi:hypothetical protein